MSLHQAVTAILRPSKTGCRVEAGRNCVHIYDLHRWNHEQSELLRATCPTMELCVHSTAQSLSGFALEIWEPPPPQCVTLRLLASMLLLMLGLALIKLA
jgi:hypothetical protein